MSLASVTRKTSSTSHLPAAVRWALHRAKLEPQAHDCFKNAMQAVLNQDEVPLLYVEGSGHIGGVVLAHAWVRTMDGEDVDITSQVIIDLKPTLVLSATELKERIAANRYRLRSPATTSTPPVESVHV